MNEMQQELFEKQLISITKGLEYPRTPEIARALITNLRRSRRPHPTLRLRRLALSLAVIVILCSSLMLIPPARAAILEFIQIGVVRIFRAEPTPVTPPQGEVPVTATPEPTARPLIPILAEVAGEMTLEKASQVVNYPILLPSYPAELGSPDYVFVQDADGPMTVLVWLDRAQPGQILMSLHFLPSGSWVVKKAEPRQIEETTVNGERAIWAEGPYPIQYSNGQFDYVRFIDGHVLIWAEEAITYRLETDLSMEEAVRIAESLEPVP